MFESLFKNAEEENGKAANIKEDVEWILKNTNYILLRAAWDEFLHLNRIDAKYDEDEQSQDIEGAASDCWYALKRLQSLDFDFSKFDIFDLHLLKALKEGYLIYDEILHILSDHHNDTREAKYLFMSHPEIHKYLPREFDNPKQALEVLAESARLFRWELEQFSKKYSAKIDAATRVIAANYLKK